MRQSVARDKARAAVKRQRQQTNVKRTIRASYDAAQNTGNDRWWSPADSLSARATNTLAVRTKLIQRSRYEVTNNSWAQGMLRTLVDQVVGTGPMLQLTQLSGDLASEVESKFREYTDEIDLANILRIGRFARGQDGESFLQLTENPKLESAVTMYPRLYEADQISTPMPSYESEDAAVDGIIFDQYGNPKTYHRLKSHPGGLGQWAASMSEKIDVPADLMIHDFRIERPGQARGVPEITAALPLFALLRDFTLATIDAAKAAAYFTAVIHTDLPPTSPTTGDAAGETELDALESVFLNRNMATTLPAGYKIQQVAAEHPTTSYKEFCHHLINEAARCLCMPLNVAIANSEGYNYSSGRLDWQGWHRSIAVDRQRIGRVILDRIFREWVREAVLIEGYLSQPLRNLSTDWSHQWRWPGFGHVDPAKEAGGQKTRLESGTTSLQIELAAQGMDWEEVQDQQIRAQLRQRQREDQIAKEMGIEREPTNVKKE